MSSFGFQTSRSKASQDLQISRIDHEPCLPPGAHCRIGVLVLSTDHGTEPELRAMLSGEDVTFYASRFAAYQEPSNETRQPAAGPLMELTRATSLLLPGTRLDAIAYACTSGSVVLGETNVSSHIEMERPGVPCITPMAATVQALRVLNIDRIAMISPYDDSLNRRCVAYLAEHEINVSRIAAFSCTRDIDIVQIPADAIVEAAVVNCDSQVQGLFLPCNALRASRAVHEIERAVGRPCITSNQAMLWRALRSAGCDLRIDGFGRLLSL